MSDMGGSLYLRLSKTSPQLLSTRGEEKRLCPFKISPVYLSFLHTFLTIHREDMDASSEILAHVSGVRKCLGDISASSTCPTNKNNFFGPINLTKSSLELSHRDELGSFDTNLIELEFFSHVNEFE